MTSQQFSPDLPDFTTENSAGVVNVQTATVTAGTSAEFGLSGVASYSVFLEGIGNDPIIVAFIAAANATLTAPLNVVVFSAVSDPLVSVGTYMLQLPSYGELLTLIVQSASVDVAVTVLSSNRPVDKPNINEDYNPSGPYIQRGPFVAATAQPLTSETNGNSLYVSNVECGLTAVASGAGLLEYWYVDFLGNTWTQPIAALVAGVPVFVERGLPWGVGGFYFTPTASDAAGTITVYAQPIRN